MPQCGVACPLGDGREQNQYEVRTKKGKRRLGHSRDRTQRRGGPHRCAMRSSALPRPCPCPCAAPPCVLPLCLWGAGGRDPGIAVAVLHHRQRPSDHYDRGPQTVAAFGGGLPTVQGPGVGTGEGDIKWGRCSPPCSPSSSRRRR